MSVLWVAFCGGESQQTDKDGSVTPAAAAGWTVVTSPKVTGIGAWRCNANGSHATAPYVAVGYFAASTPIGAWEAQAVLSGSPSNAFCLAGENTDSALALECGTDGKLRLVRLGTGAARWTGRTALTGWSATALATDDSTFKHLFFSSDPLTLGATHSWVALLIDGVEQWTVDVGSLTAQYVYCVPNIGSVNSGVSVTLDDIFGMIGTDAGDAPHLVPWPVGEVYNSYPKSNLSQSWTASGGGAGSFSEWDETSAHDSDTTYNKATTTNKFQTSYGQTAADLGISGHTVILNGVAGYAPALLFWHRIVSGVGTKFNGWTTCQNATDVQVSQPPTSYTATGVLLERTSGSWSISDVGSWYGLKTEASAHDNEWRCTKEQVHWPVYIDTVQAATTPRLPISQVYVI